MAAGHAVRGAATAWLALIALQTVTTSGAGRVSGALAGLNGLVLRALDPRVPAIPDRRGGTARAGSGSGFTVTPGVGRVGAAAAGGSSAVTAATGPGGALSGLPSLNQYAGGGGLPAGLANNPALHPAG